MIEEFSPVHTNLLKEAAILGFTSLTEKIVGGTAIATGLVIWEKGNAISHNGQLISIMNGPEREAVVAGAIGFGAAFLITSIPFDVMSVRRVAQYVKESAAYGLKVMIENMNNIPQGFQQPRF